MPNTSGPLTSADTERKFKEFKARADAHDTAVRKGAIDVAAPEMVEYVKRWDAFRDEIGDIERRIGETTSWVMESEVDLLNAKLKTLLIQWDTVGTAIQVRKNQDKINVLQELVKDKGVTPPPPIPKSPATTPPPAPSSLPAPAPSDAPLGKPNDDGGVAKAMAIAVLVMGGVLILALVMLLRKKKK